MRNHRKSLIRNTVPQVSPQLFRRLFDTVYIDLLNGSTSMMAVLLGVGHRRITSWQNSEPTSPWVAISCAHILKNAIRQYRASGTKKHRNIAARVMKTHAYQDALKLLGDSHTPDDYEGPDDAVKHLLMTINEQPGQIISTKDLRLAAYSGGYTLRTLRTAAETLRLDIKTEGFGENKQTYYSIPRSDDQ